MFKSPFYVALLTIISIVCMPLSSKADNELSPESFKTPVAKRIAAALGDAAEFDAITIKEVNNNWKTSLFCKLEIKYFHRVYFTRYRYKEWAVANNKFTKQDIQDAKDLSLFHLTEIDRYCK